MDVPSLWERCVSWGFLLCSKIYKKISKYTPLSCREKEKGGDVCSLTCYNKNNDGGEEKGTRKHFKATQIQRQKKITKA